MADELARAFAVLVEDTLRRCDQATKDLEELERAYGRGVQDRSYRTYMSALQLVTQTTRLFITERGDAFVPQTDPELRSSIYELVRSVAATMPAELEGQIQLLRLPRSEELGVFAAPMTRLANKLISNAEVLFFPWTAFEGYRLETYSGDRAERLAPGNKDNLERAYGEDIQFLQLRHPSPRRTDLFQHAVFAHELAHAAIRQPLPPDLAQMLPSPAPGQPQPSYASAAAGSAPAGLPESAETLLEWYTELACDVVGMRLIGPAFLVAFAEVTAANRSVEGGDKFRTHPAPEVRFRVLQEEVERFSLRGYQDDVQAALDHFSRSHEGTHAQPTPSPQAREWLDEALAEFRGPRLRRLLARAEYSPATLQKDLPHVLRLANAGIPPAERITGFDTASSDHKDGDEWSKEIDWRSILNGVLFRYLRDWGAPEIGSDRRRPEARREAVRLAMGGIELSEFQRQARAFRTQVHDLRLNKEWAP